MRVRTGARAMWVGAMWVGAAMALGIAPALAQPVPAPANQLVTTEDGTCRLWVPIAIAGRPNWTGTCSDGLAEGPGSAIWRAVSGRVTHSINATFSRGIPTGMGSSTGTPGEAPVRPRAPQN